MLIKTLFSWNYTQFCFGPDFQVGQVKPGLGLERQAQALPFAPG